MTIRNEALISRYFDRQMTSGEEQNFLISLAASDELRLAFRSHLELMKAIRDDKQEMQPIAEVRGRTLAALGLSAAATAPFLEQALLHSNSARAATQSTTSAVQSIPTSKPFFARLIGKTVLTGSGLVMGFLAASLFFSAPQIHNTQILSGAKQIAPSSQPSQAISPATVQSEEPKTKQKSTTNHALHSVMAQTATEPVSIKPDAKQTSTPTHHSAPTGTILQTQIGGDTAIEK